MKGKVRYMNEKNLILREFLEIKDQLDKVRAESAYLEKRYKELEEIISTALSTSKAKVSTPPPISEQSITPIPNKIRDMIEKIEKENPEIVTIEWVASSMKITKGAAMQRILKAISLNKLTKVSSGKYRLKGNP